MAYLIFTDIKEAESYQAKVDAELGYPEDINSLTYVGNGIHAPKELGLAVHFSYPVANDKEDSWFLPKQDATTAVCISPLPDKIVEQKIVPVPVKATEVAELPADFLKAEAVLIEEK